MSGNTNNKSDLGFIIFLILAFAIIIPLGIGFENFENLLKTIKIALGIIFGILIIVVGISIYYFYKRKVGKRNKSKFMNEQNNQTIVNSKNENDEKINKVKIEIIDEAQDSLNQQQTDKEIDELSKKLKKINNEFNL
ncbi:MAG: hypothetical protein FK731_06365 [Asgard group archaeon]|nr:hypothetical protein [Asgard group archaeon]